MSKKFVGIFVGMFVFYGHYGRENFEPNDYDDNISILSFADTLDRCMYESLVNYYEILRLCSDKGNEIEFEDAEKIFKKISKNIANDDDDNSDDNSDDDTGTYVINSRLGSNKITYTPDIEFSMKDSPLKVAFHVPDTVNHRSILFFEIPKDRRYMNIYMNIDIDYNVYISRDDFIERTDITFSKTIDEAREIAKKKINDWYSDNNININSDEDDESDDSGENGENESDDEVPQGMRKFVKNKRYSGGRIGGYYTTIEYGSQAAYIIDLT
jgi:hypothetical protein